MALEAQRLAAQHTCLTASYAAFQVATQRAVDLTPFGVPWDAFSSASAVWDAFSSASAVLVA